MSMFDRMFRARNTDPLTSHLAASSIKEGARQHALIILNSLLEYGPMGKDGIASRCSLESMQVARRLHELQRIGLITLTGRDVKSKSNRWEREWMIVTPESKQGILL